MNLGVIGLGMMGHAMARNLLRAGHRVTVWNRTRSRAEELQAEGALIAETPADACRGEAVITCLADDGAVKAIVFGKNGLAGALAAGGVHISMCTLSLGVTGQLSQAHGEAGQRFIAAPVFGRPDTAAAARLLIVASGDAEAMAQCQPVFDALGQRTIVVGTDPGAAAMVKLVGNFLLASAVESLAEALALLRKSGTDPQACLDVLTNTLFAAPVYKNYAGLMLEQRYDPGFRLSLGLKDVGLVLDAAASFDVPMPVASLVRDRLLAGVARGYQDKDLSALALICAEDAGLKKEAGVMSTAENKQLMQNIFSELSKGNGKPFVESLADDFCWTIIGTTKWSKTYRGKRAVLTELLGPLFSQFADQYTNTAQRFIAEGDYVVVECRGQVTTKSGLPYNNTYCWVCRIAKGKLQELTEYCDTELIAAALGIPK